MSEKVVQNLSVQESELSKQLNKDELATEK